jgi:hypothetical protein
MTINEVVAVNNEFMTFCSLEEPQFKADGSFVNSGNDIFSVDGSSKQIEWILPPKVLLQSDPINKKKYKGKAKKIPDIGYIGLGSLVLNQRAVDILGDYLNEFGELLTMDVEGINYYFYNVTHVIDLIDYKRSSFDEKQARFNTLFDAKKTPTTSQIFKVKGLESSRIYTNDIAGQKSFISLIKKAGLQGFSYRPVKFSE